MWLLWTAITFVVLGWVGYGWIRTLSTKYEHTTESIAILFALLVLANFLGLKLTYVMAPVWGIWPRLVLTIPLGFVMFLGFSFVAVNLWCSFLTRDFDEQIGELEEEQDNLQRRLDILRWRHITESISSEHDVQDKAHREGYRTEANGDEIERLQTFVDNWQQVDGAARVRSIKVSEWKAQARKQEIHELRDTITLLESEIEKQTDEAKTEQLKAKMSIFKMEIAERQETDRPKAEPLTKKLDGARHQTESEGIRHRLRDVHNELQITEAQKREFLRGKVRLTWRVRS